MSNDKNPNQPANPIPQPSGRDTPAEEPNRDLGLAAKPTPGTTTSPWIKNK